MFSAQTRETRGAGHARRLMLTAAAWVSVHCARSLLSPDEAAAAAAPGCADVLADLTPGRRSRPTEHRCRTRGCRRPPTVARRFCHYRHSETAEAISPRHHRRSFRRRPAWDRHRGTVFGTALHPGGSGRIVRAAPPGCREPTGARVTCAATSPRRPDGRTPAREARDRASGRTR